MKQFTEEFVLTCPTCQKVKADRIRTMAFIKHLPLPLQKWQSISIDWFVGVQDVIRNSTLCNAVLTVTDWATIMVPLMATSSDKTAVDTAQLLLTNVARIHVLPKSII